MAWVNFGILGLGGLLLAVPIVLHFLMQPKPQLVDFPALRFLQEQQRTTRSKMRLRHDETAIGLKLPGLCFGFPRL